MDHRRERRRAAAHEPRSVFPGPRHRGRPGHGHGPHDLPSASDLDLRPGPGARGSGPLAFPLGEPPPARHERRPSLGAVPLPRAFVWSVPGGVRRVSSSSRSSRIRPVGDPAFEFNVPGGPSDRPPFPPPRLRVVAGGSRPGPSLKRNRGRGDRPLAALLMARGPANSAFPKRVRPRAMAGGRGFGGRLSPLERDGDRRICSARFPRGGLDRRPPARDPFPLGIRKNSGLASGPSGQPTSIHRGSLDEPLDVGGARDRDRHRLGLVLFVASPSARLFLGGVGAADAPSGFGPCADGHLRGGTLSLRAPRRRGGRGGPFVGSFRRGGPAGPGLGARRLGGGVGSLGGAFLGAGGGLAGRTIALDFDGQPGPRTRLFVAVPSPGAGGKGPIPRSRGGIPSRFARRSYPRSRRGGADQFIGPSTSGRGSRGRPCLGR